MSELEESLTLENNTSSPSPPSPSKDSKSNEESKDGNSTPSSNWSPSPPSVGDDVSNKKASSSPSNNESFDLSPPSPPPKKSSPPTSSPSPETPPSPSNKQSPPSPSTPSSSSSPPPSPPPPPPPPPPEEQSPPPPSPTPSKKQSPFSSSPSPPPPKKQSSPPSSPPPPKQKSSPPSDSSSRNSPQSPSEKSPLPPPPLLTTSPPQPPSSETSKSLYPSPGFSSPAPNVATKTLSELSPHASALRPPQSSPNAIGASPPSKGGPNDQKGHAIAKNAKYDVMIDATVVGAFFIVAFIALFFFVRKKGKKKEAFTPPPTNIEVKSDAAYYNPQLDGLDSTLVNGSEAQRLNNYHGPESGIIAGSKTFFTYEELMEMTDGFARDNIIGEGGFGCVYKGRMPDGRFVAVKRLKVGNGQGEREFKAEVEIISRIHHRHLVSLVGYCISENQRLLIYDFVRNKTLEHHLHGKGMPVLEWPQRMKIAIGAAKGLAYLHEDCHPRIIHRDIKSANILLEDDFEAQVADFGLARLNDSSQSHVSTRVMGTFGYLAPEYASSGKLTDRSDVFSFGVVLLELITGRKPVDPTQPLGDESLVEWARPLLIQALETSDFSEIIDARLEKRYVESEVLMMIEAAAACVRRSATKRPRMALVVRALDFDGSDLTNGVKVGQSTVYDSAKYSEEILNFRRMALGTDTSSESDIYSDEFTSREISRGQPSWRSECSSSEFTSGESELQPIKKNGSGYSDNGTSGNCSGGRFN
ncbi:proline-rich receptor-like protein kinase PERK13 [Gossypium arboreum]|uniref:non-specific serine/threonine protein kinase n=1 Tax=Gossypium arboreum TaxID=29729 RepID=A0ABR0QDZ8_GOSAR|nr:proline-rich receptor-like protein kinase PERK13 [Gossypium arboreum]KAK5837440.1 hypothetical protein PVK06_013250 [Gossypium arboreum]